MGIIEIKKTEQNIYLNDPNIESYYEKMTFEDFKKTYGFSLDKRHSYLISYCRKKMAILKKIKGRRVILGWFEDIEPSFWNRLTVKE